MKSFLASASFTARDRVSILVFGGMHPQLLCLRNCQKSQQPPHWPALRADGATPLYDAVVQAAEILSLNRDPAMRPAIVLFSDGRDTISRHSMRDALDAAESLAAPIYTVNPCRAGCESQEGDSVLAALASESGGLSFAPGQNLPGVLSQVLEDLHSGYVLTYEAFEPPRGRHSVRLLPTGDATLRLRSRRGYDDSPGEN